MKIRCKNCGYERESLKNYEDYKCSLCHSMMNEVKEEFFDSFKKSTLDIVVRDNIIASLKISIVKLGRNKVWNIIEAFKKPIMRLRYRKFYYKAMIELEKEKGE